VSLHVKTTLLSAIKGRTLPHGSENSEVKHGANVRFYDSQSAIVWNELSAEAALSLVPVREIGTDQLTSEIETLHRVYTNEPPYVFLHVSVSETETHGVVL
jgi:hypothetical protein